MRTLIGYTESEKLNIQKYSPENVVTVILQVCSYYNSSHYKLLVQSSPLSKPDQCISRLDPHPRSWTLCSQLAPDSMFNFPGHSFYSNDLGSLVHTLNIGVQKGTMPVTDHANTRTEDVTLQVYPKSGQQCSSIHDGIRRSEFYYNQKMTQTSWEVTFCFSVQDKSFLLKIDNQSSQITGPEQVFTILF